MSKEIALLALVVAPAAPRADIINVPGEEPTIQAGIDAAGPGDEVVIACDTYYEHDIVLKSGVTVRGENGDPACVSVDAQGQGSVFTADGVDASAALQAITITGGDAADGGGLLCQDSSLDITNCAFDANTATWGGGLAVYGQSFPAITGCNFEDNESTIDGGGVYCWNGAHPIFEGCTFTSNHAAGSGGGLITEDCEVTLTGCWFSQNTADFYAAGVDIYDGSTATITGCYFIENVATLGGGGVLWDVYSDGSLSDSFFWNNVADYGAGLYCYQSSPTVSGCEFSANVATLGTLGIGAGIYCEYDSSPSVSVCTFRGNFAAEGGGVYVDEGCAPTFTRCTFYSNSATDQGSGFCVYAGSAVIDACIIAGGIGEAVVCDDGGSATLSCCDIFGNTGGDWTGCIAGQAGGDNFSADPLFCGTPPGSMFLQPGSPCLPGNHPNGEDCGLIGALNRDSDCDGQAAVAPSSWSAIKAIY